MDSNELKAVRQKAQEYVTAYLADCCRDELEWQNTGVLRDGKIIGKRKPTNQTTAAK